MDFIKDMVYTALSVSTTAEVKALYPKLDLRRKSSCQSILDAEANRALTDEAAHRLVEFTACWNRTQWANYSSVTIVLTKCETCNNIVRFNR